MYNDDIKPLNVKSLNMMPSKTRDCVKKLWLIK